LIPHKKPRERILTFDEEYENRIIAEFRGDIERKFGILVSNFPAAIIAGDFQKKSSIPLFVYVYLSSMQNQLEKTQKILIQVVRIIFFSVKIYLLLRKISINCKRIYSCSTLRK